ncbi:putative short-chain dehydrogenase [Xylariaceae sp. FL0662B]|nr:putative short-chain dehydrogenase [Xylariaceae sp. FL0662B]
MPQFNVDTIVSEVVKVFGDNALGKIYVIPGPSSGGIARRSLSEVQPVIDEIANTSHGATVTTFVPLDLADLSSAASDGIDGLYNNAGIMAPREFKKSADGVGQHRSWTLTDPKYDDINFQDGKTYHGWIAYSRSKTANIHFSISLAKRVKKLGVTVFAVEPGMAMDSNLTKNSGVDNDWFGEGYRLATERGKGKVPSQPIINLQQAAATPVLTFLDPDLKKSSGSYFEECEIKDAKLADYAKSPAEAEKLWKVSEKFIGEEFSLYSSVAARGQRLYRTRK